MEENKNEEIYAYIKFYSETKKIILTQSFDEFKKKICNILNLKEGLFLSLKISYKDIDGDCISICTDEDYNILLSQVKDKEVETLNIEVEQNSEIDISACSNSIFNYQEKSEDEENKDNENDIKKDKEIILNKLNKYPNVPINKIDINDMNLDEDNLREKKFMVFPCTCNICTQYPIVKVLYHCPKCALFLCEECEENLGINHRHSILKIQTKNQFEDADLKINNDLQNEKNKNVNNQQQINNMSNSFKGVLGIINIFGNNNKCKDDNIKLNKNKNQEFSPKKMNLIQLARIKYDLNGISDDKLEEAIKKANGNIDEAITILMS